MSKVCEQCGKSFEPVLRHPGQRFCNKKCSDIWHYQQRRHEYTCQGCGQLFKAKKPDRNKFCSRECAWEYRRWHPAESRVRGIAPVFGETDFWRTQTQMACGYAEGGYYKRYWCVLTAHGDADGSPALQG